MSPEEIKQKVIYILSTAQNVNAAADDIVDRVSNFAVEAAGVHDIIKENLELKRKVYKFEKALKLKPGDTVWIITEDPYNVEEPQDCISNLLYLATVGDYVILTDEYYATPFDEQLRQMAGEGAITSSDMFLAKISNIHFTREEALDEVLPAFEGVE